MRAKWVSSTRLGSTSTILTSLGSVLSSSEVSNALSMTLLPLPVVPATSRCGMSARSKNTARPEMSLPNPTGRVQSFPLGVLQEDVAQCDLRRSGVRHLDADRALARYGRQYPDLRRGQRVRYVLL